MTQPSLPHVYVLCHSYFPVIRERSGHASKYCVPFASMSPPMTVVEEGVESLWARAASHHCHVTFANTCVTSASIARSKDDLTSSQPSTLVAVNVVAGAGSTPDMASVILSSVRTSPSATSSIGVLFMATAIVVRDVQEIGVTQGLGIGDTSLELLDASCRPCRFSDNIL